MNLREELIKYAIWYDNAVMPEDNQTDQQDLIQNVDSYLQTNCKNYIFPSHETSKKAMLKNKVKFVDNMEDFSSRKNAYKSGWKDCFNWILKLNETK